ncbi:hypothetical protein BLA29_006684, partial [Euroglyphus maynei]
MKTGHLLIMIVNFILLSNLEASDNRRKIIGYHYDTEKFVRNLLKLVPRNDDLLKSRIPLFHHHGQLRYDLRTKYPDDNGDGHQITLIKRFDRIIERAMEEIGHLRSISKLAFIKQMNKFVEHVRYVRQQIIDAGCSD